MIELLTLIIVCMILSFLLTTEKQTKEPTPLPDPKACELALIDLEYMYQQAFMHVMHQQDASKQLDELSQSEARIKKILNQGRREGGGR